MPNFNKNSFGQLLKVNFFQDISTGTSFEMQIEPQFGGQRLDGDKPILTVVGTLGTVNTVVDDMPFKADQYLEYTIKEDDLKDVGRWRVKGIATLLSVTVATNYQFFRVLP